VVATIAEARELKCIRLHLSYLHNHSERDLDMKRHANPQVEAFLEKQFADHRKDATTITAALRDAWPRLHEEIGGGPGVPLTMAQVQQRLTAFYLRQYGPQTMKECQDRSARS